MTKTTHKDKNRTKAAGPLPNAPGESSERELRSSRANTSEPTSSPAPAAKKTGNVSTVKTNKEKAKPTHNSELIQFEENIDAAKKAEGQKRKKVQDKLATTPVVTKPSAPPRRLATRPSAYPISVIRLQLKGM